ncbi:FG-GAP repeat protein [Leptospira broomii serovar Hurstbridge str. 5399]|uniref:FG-GAP repeat protein n=1 Tax=Leptospira broomii serovar Hurstbridge str. 5399 TaxID=1049789 RepID=T0GDW1_9LEPT|nr:FG-GAP repeat protein [Leptospira broomii]EQA45009.1 FG-GAP repeat protein [Leptospira broomii serovar Hurstbridge str. 5399]
MNPDPSLKRNLCFGILTPLLFILLCIAGCKKHNSQAWLFLGLLSSSSLPIQDALGLSQMAYLKAPNTSNNDQFGYSVSIDGDTIVAGAPFEDSNTTSIIQDSNLSSTNDNGNDTGAVYVFARSGPKWTHQAYLKAPNASNTDNFGTSVAIDGDTIAVGSSGEDSNTTTIINGPNLSSTNDSGNNVGAVYIFIRNGTTWTHQAYLKAPNASDVDQFGSSLSISGNTVVVGSSGEDSNTTTIINGSNLSSANDSGNNVGAAYVFIRSGSNWTHQAYLKAPNGFNLDSFGNSVTIDGNTIAIGAKMESSTTTSIIQGTDLSATNRNGSGNGAVYVYFRSGTTWTHQAYLKASNASNSDLFGNSVAIKGNTIVVGSPFESSDTNSIVHGPNLSATNNAGSNNGAVYVFERVGTIWNQDAYLKAPNSSNQQTFGASVGIFGNRIVAGAPGETSTTNSIIHGSDLNPTNREGFFNGAVYVFERSGAQWSHRDYLKPSNNTNGIFFGGATAISGNTIVAGALAESSNSNWIINGSDLSSANKNGANNGAAYVFGL